MKNATPILKITIHNEGDIELFDLVSSIASINDQYYRFISQGDKKRSDCRLCVNKITEGSIIIDIFERAPVVLPAIAPVLIEYSAFIVATADYLCGRLPSLPDFYKFMREDFINFKKFFEIVANMRGNFVNIQVFNFGKVVINNHYSHVDASAAQNGCDKEIKRLEKAGESLIRERVNLDLYQARDSALSRSTRGNLGIIDHICTVPKPLSFATDRMMYDITKSAENPLNFIYSVDVAITLREGSLCFVTHKDIKGYEILKLHGPIEKRDLFDSGTKD